MRLNDREEGEAVDYDSEMREEELREESVWANLNFSDGWVSTRCQGQAEILVWMEGHRCSLWRDSSPVGSSA